MLIPKVAEVFLEAEPVQLFWCWSCEELFAFVGSPGRFAAGFAQVRRGGWQRFRSRGAERDVRLAVAAVSQVGPQNTTGPA
jgi:hypothetical protein